MKPSRSPLLIAVAAIGALLLSSPCASGRSARKTPRLIFPVVGPASFIDDYGDPRGRHGHQGNDLMAKKKSIVVAVEKGKVTFWTRSASAGCMLYLRGASGAVYQYIHLNNDRTMRNDNRGRCVPGTAYAKGLRDGARVAAGQPIGFVGDSGDANGIDSHLHFEIHPRGGSAVNPYRQLKRARVLLFATRPGSRVSLMLKGTLIAADSISGKLSLRLSDLDTSSGVRLSKLQRTIAVALRPDTLVIDPSGNQVELGSLDVVPAGSELEIATTSARATLATQLGSPGALSAFSVTVLSSS